MLKQNKILLILLAVQVALVFWLNTGSSALSVSTANSKLFEKSLADSTGLEISDSSNLIKLAMVKGAWVLPEQDGFCLLYTSPSPRDKRQSRMPSSA